MYNQANSTIVCCTFCFVTITHCTQELVSKLTAVIQRSSALLLCPSHAESCRKQLACQQPAINNHTLQQRLRRWKQYVWMRLELWRRALCAYIIPDDKERRNERGERRNGEGVHVCHLILYPQWGNCSCRGAHSRGRNCVCVCVCLTSSFSIFSVERRDCSCWNRRRSSACTCGNAVIWFTWNINMHKYTYYRNRSAEQTNHLILFIIIVAFLPLSRPWIVKKRTGNDREVLDKICCEPDLNLHRPCDHQGSAYQSIFDKIWHNNSVWNWMCQLTSSTIYINIGMFCTQHLVKINIRV